MWNFSCPSLSGHEWCILSEVIKTVFCKNYEFKKAVAQLKDNGFLLKACALTRVPHLGVTRIYSISGKIIL